MKISSHQPTGLVPCRATVTVHLADGTTHELEMFGFTPVMRSPRGGLETLGDWFRRHGARPARFEVDFREQVQKWILS